ncbi:hypothetical protein P0Y35_02920 [Kiritimatiellaeota bacterium B1221]|nr:hypothetical protein [Kiritimatiellaeota bacterium B1221]
MRTSHIKILLGISLLSLSSQIRSQSTQTRPTVSVSVYETLTLAEKAVEKEDYKQAMALVRTELLKDPGNPYLLYNYGLAAYLAKDYKIARDAWGRLKSLEGENQKLGRDLASLSLFQLGNADVKEAMKFEQARNTNDALLLYRRALSLYQFSVNMEGDGSKKAKNNLENTQKKFVALISSTSTKRLDSLEKKFSAEQKRTDTRKKRWGLDSIESKLRDVQTDLEEALSRDPEYETAQQGLKKSKELLEDVTLENARLSRDNLRKMLENNKFRNQESKLNTIDSVLERYDEVLEVNPDNTEAQDEKGALAREAAENILDAAMKDVESSEKHMEKKDERRAIASLEKAQEKLEDALSLDSTSPKIQQAESENREKLADLKEKRADALVDKAETESNPDRKVKSLETAVNDYEDVQNMKETEDAGLQQKLEDAQKSLAKAHEESGDKLTKSSDWMDQFMALETGKETDHSQKSENELQTDISKMERGIKEYEMASNLDPSLESAKTSREQAKQKLSELRDGLNKKRLSEEKKQAAQTSDQDGEPTAPEDTTAEIDFENENLRDLKVTRDIFRQRNYDTDRQDVKRDW